MSESWNIRNFTQYETQQHNHARIANIKTSDQSTTDQCMMENVSIEIYVALVQHVMLIGLVCGMEEYIAWTLLCAERDVHLWKNGYLSIDLACHSSIVSYCHYCFGLFVACFCCFDDFD